jgi:hypothetical protein
MMFAKTLGGSFTTCFMSLKLTRAMSSGDFGRVEDLLGNRDSFEAIWFDPVEIMCSGPPPKKM